MRRLLIVLLSGLLFSIQSLAVEKHDYLLGQGDVIRITVYDHPDLATDARIAENGTIQFPLVGDVALSGRSTAEAGDYLATLLDKGGFVKQPQVTVMVSQFRSQQISVLGYVARPGKYPIEQRSNVLDLLALAGGLNASGADMAILIHGHGSAEKRQMIDLIALFENGEARQNPEVGNGDVIYVPREARFYIYGEVQRAGTYRIERNMTVMQALSVAGGPSIRGTDRRLKVNRRAANGEVMTTSIRLEDPVLPDDVIYVPESLF